MERSLIFRGYPLQDIMPRRAENNICAGVMELADVTDSKSVGSDTVWVRVPPPAPKRKRRPMGVFFFLVPVGNAEPVQRVSLCPDETRKETLTVSFHTILPSGGDKNTP